MGGAVYKDYFKEQWCPHLSWRWVQSPLGVWRTTHTPQLILDLCPQGFRKEADTGNGESSLKMERFSLVPVKLQQNQHYDDPQ